MITKKQRRNLLVLAAAIFIVPLAIVAGAKAAPASDRASQVMLGVVRGPYVADSRYGQATIQVQSTTDFEVPDIDINIWPCYAGPNMPPAAPITLFNRPRHIKAANEDLTTPDGQGWTLRWHINQVPAFGHPLSLKLNINVPLVSYTAPNGTLYAYPFRCVEITVSSPSDSSVGPEAMLSWPDVGKGGK